MLGGGDRFRQLVERDDGSQGLVFRVILSLAAPFATIAAFLGVIQLIRELEARTIVLWVVASLAWFGAIETYLRQKSRLSWILLISSVLATAGAVVTASGDGDSVPLKPHLLKQFEPVQTIGHPRAIAATGKRYLWVVGTDESESRGTLARIDSQHLKQETKVIKSFDAVEPYDIAVGKGAIWVTDRDTLIKLDLSGEEIWRHSIGNRGENEVDVYFNRVWFKQTEPGLLFGLDPRTGKVLSEHSFETEATAIAAGLGGVWVSNARSDPAVVARVGRDGKVKKRIVVQDDPQDMAPGAELLFVAHATGNFVTRIDPRYDGGTELPGDIELGDTELPSGVAAGNRVGWVSMKDSGAVIALDECDGSMLDSAETENSPYDVAVLGKKVFVPNNTSGSISVFKLKTPLGPCN